MSMKSIISRWVVGGLLVMIVAGGCTSLPARHRSLLQSSDGKYVYEDADLDGSGGGGFNPINYYYHWSLEAADGTIYERTEYYTTDQDDVAESYYSWYIPLRLKASDPSMKDGSYKEYGWYTCITHPPGGTNKCKVVICITHPPGGAYRDNSK